MNNSNSLFVALIFLLVASPIFIYWQSESEQLFSGSDQIAIQQIEKLYPEYQPWCANFWQPPSSEVESLMFTLQASVGALIIGYYLGRFSSKNKGV